MQIYYVDDQACLFDPDSLFGRTSPEPSPPERQRARTSASCWRRLAELKYPPYMYLDLTAESTNLLGGYAWEILSPWDGAALMLKTGVCPREESASSLSQILEAAPQQRYYLSPKACLGILRRALERGKALPDRLKAALEVQAGIGKQRIGRSEVEAYHINQRDEGIPLGEISGALMATNNMQMQTFVTGTPTAFAANQRDEVRDLHDVAGALGAQPGMKQQTFIANSCLTPWDTQQKRIFPANGRAPTLTDADGGGGRNPGGLLFAAGVVSKGNGECFITPENHTSLTMGGGQAGQGYPCVLTAAFSAGAGSSAGGIGYSEDCYPTLKGSESGNMMPSVLCVNDQGGQSMYMYDDISGTLRAQEHGHQPLVYENHGQDSRYNGPYGIAPTISSKCGSGGNNAPLVDAYDDSPICIVGNTIDRQPQNGGNGAGFQENLAYTLTATDRLSGHPDNLSNPED